MVKKHFYQALTEQAEAMLLTTLQLDKLYLTKDYPGTKGEEILFSPCV